MKTLIYIALALALASTCSSCSSDNEPVMTGNDSIVMVLHPNHGIVYNR